MKYFSLSTSWEALLRKSFDLGIVLKKIGKPNKKKTKLSNFSLSTSWESWVTNRLVQGNDLILEYYCSVSMSPTDYVLFPVTMSCLYQSTRSSAFIWLLLSKEKTNKSWNYNQNNFWTITPAEWQNTIGLSWPWPVMKIWRDISVCERMGWR